MGDTMALELRRCRAKPSLRQAPRAFSFGGGARPKRQLKRGGGIIVYLPRIYQNNNNCYLDCPGYHGRPRMPWPADSMIRGMTAPVHLTSVRPISGRPGYHGR